MLVLQMMLTHSTWDAIRRRWDQDHTCVRARAEEVWTLDWRPTGATVVDGSRPSATILTEIQSLIWSRL